MPVRWQGIRGTSCRQASIREQPTPLEILTPQTNYIGVSYKGMRIMAGDDHRRTPHYRSKVAP